MNWVGEMVYPYGRHLPTCTVLALGELLCDVRGDEALGIT